MKTWHPESWSKQARKMADNQFRYFVQANECGDPEFWMLQPDEDYGWTRADEACYIHFFSNSYRHPRIRHRAAKRFGRLVRKYKAK